MSGFSQFRFFFRAVSMNFELSLQYNWIHMKKILAPVDFSENAKSSLLYAADLCKDRNLELHIIHVQDMHKERFESEESALYLKNNENTFNNIVSDISGNYPDLSISTAFLTGNVINTIDRYVHDNNIDFTIIGKTGFSAIETVLFGSVTRGIIEKIHSPVIVIPKEISYSYSKAGALGFATDFKYFPEGHNLAAIEFFTNVLDYPFYILHYDVPGEPYNSKASEKKMLEIFKGKVNEISYFYSGSFKETLDTFAEKNDIKMYIMISKEKSFFKKLIEGHKTTSFATVTPYPLIILHKQT